MGNTFGAHIFKHAMVGEREEVTIKLFKPDGTPLYLGDAPEIPSGIMSWMGDYSDTADYPPGSVVRGGGKTYIVAGSENMPVGIGLGVNPGVPTFRGFIPRLIDAYGVYPEVIDGNSPSTIMYAGRQAQAMAISAIRVAQAGTLSVKAATTAGNGDTEFALFSSTDSVTPITHTDDVFSSQAGLNAFAITPGLYFILGALHNDAVPSTGNFTWSLGPDVGASTAVLGPVMTGNTVDSRWEQVA